MRNSPHHCLRDLGRISVLLGVSVLSSGVGAEEGLRDVVGPVALQSDWWWVGIVLAILAVFLVVLAGVLLWRSRRKAGPCVPPKASWEIAFEALDRLAQGSELQEGRIKEYYSALSGIIRQYIEARFLIRAPGMTTEEFMDKARCSVGISEAQKVFLRDFLDASDMVKFAKFIPAQEPMIEALRLARRFVAETQAPQEAADGV